MAPKTNLRICGNKKPVDAVVGLLTNDTEIPTPGYHCW